MAEGIKKMTKYEIIKEIGLDNYYINQKEANQRMMKQSKSTIELALSVFRNNPTPATREFVGRVLTGIHKLSVSVDKIK